MQVADATAVLLAVLLAFSAAVKADESRTGAAAWHPLALLAGWTTGRARWLFGLSAASDAAVAVGLVLSPSGARWPALGLVILYSVVGWSYQAGSAGTTCRCFGSLLDVSTRRALLVRNGVLAAALMVPGSARAPVPVVVAGVLLATTVVIAVVHLLDRAAAVAGSSPLSALERNPT